MTMKKLMGATTIACALGLSSIGLGAGAANADPVPQDVPGFVEQAQPVAMHGGEGHGGDRWRGPHWYGPCCAGWAGPPCYTGCP
jgi:hypothetical protein